MDACALLHGFEVVSRIGTALKCEMGDVMTADNGAHWWKSFLLTASTGCRRDQLIYRIRAPAMWNALTGSDRDVQTATIDVHRTCLLNADSC